jgi:hypothetical protein
MALRLEPRPLNDVIFFQGLLESIAGIEVSGYQRLQSLGAPKNELPIGCVTQMYCYHLLKHR